LDMKCEYLGHYSRELFMFDGIRANYRVVISRGDNNSLTIPEFTVSFFDSWLVKSPSDKEFRALGQVDIDQAWFKNVVRGWSERYPSTSVKVKPGQYNTYDLGGCSIKTRTKNPPSAYDVLSCVTKSDPGTFDEFCSEYGLSNVSTPETYDELKNYRTKDKAIYKAVAKEWSSISDFFTAEELEELQEIQ